MSERLVRPKLFPMLYAIIFFVTGLIVFFDVPVMLAQSEIEPVDQREYVGSQECAACHRDLVEFHAGTSHTQALTEVSEDNGSLLADFSAGEDVRTILLPGEEEARPFTAGDISHAIGSGKYAQRYLYQTDDGQFLVLPAEWNSLEGQWQPYALSESWPDPAYDWATQCASCHTTNLNIEQGTWAEDGVQCEACHGPGSEHLDAGEAADPILTRRERAALEASIVLGLDAATCGQCHSQGTEPQHGYPFPLEYQPGEELLTRDTFRLVSERSRDHWWRTGQARQKYMQFNEWVTNAHSEAFLTVAQHPNFTPGCLSCHNVTFSRAAQIVERMEASDDRERIDILFDEADIDIDNIYNIDWETLKALALSELERDAATIDDSRPFLPQILPELIELMHTEDNLVDSQIVPQTMAGVMRVAGEGTNNDHTSQALGITCAACHDPHSTEGQPASLTSEPYALCTSCHRSAEPIYGVHHPVQEVFEGRPVIADVSGSPSGHFSAENGPTCATCHMPQVPVEHATRISHTLAPILPAEAGAVEGIQDSCTGCHGERIEGQTMQQLIDTIQTETRTRYDAVRATVDDTSPEWIMTVLQTIEGDGSWGFHNYGYTSTLLDHAERELGLIEDVAPLILPDIPAQPPPPVEVQSPAVTAPTGLTLPSIVLLAVAIGILLVSAYLFLIRGREQ